MGLFDGLLGHGSTVDPADEEGNGRPGYSKGAYDGGPSIAPGIADLSEGGPVGR